MAPDVGASFFEATCLLWCAVQGEPREKPPFAGRTVCLWQLPLSPPPLLLTVPRLSNSEVMVALDCLNLIFRRRRFREPAKVYQTSKKKRHKDPQLGKAMMPHGEVSWLDSWSPNCNNWLARRLKEKSPTTKAWGRRFPQTCNLTPSKLSNSLDRIQ